MPADYLDSERAAAFGRFAGEPARRDLARFFYLDDADRGVIANLRGEHNRLGFAVQLGTVRFLGLFLVDPLDVPWAVVDYLAGQLGVEDLSVVKRYAERVATANDHARLIRAEFGFRDLAGPTLEELSMCSRG